MQIREGPGLKLQLYAAPLKINGKGKKMKRTPKGQMSGWDDVAQGRVAALR